MPETYNNPAPQSRFDWLRLIRTPGHRLDEDARWYRERADGVRTRLSPGQTALAELRHTTTVSLAEEEAHKRNDSLLWTIWRVIRRWWQTALQVFRRSLPLASLVGVLLVASACATGASEEPETISAEEALRRSTQKLVCLDNDARLGMRVKLVDGDTGRRIHTISTQSLKDARAWVPRSRFHQKVTVVIDPVGGRTWSPRALRDIPVRPDGTPLGIQVGSYRGGNEPFAHSGVLKGCD